MCKILEHVVASHIMSHLDDNDILVRYQHGFRRKHSCEAQLINTIEEISKNLNDGEQTDAVILDFEKAFDTVAHQRLLMKVDHYGIRGPVLNWLKSWLIGRTQCVVLDGEHSENEPVKSGVPQGTVLGPIMFLVYINDIAENTSSTIKLFADDGLLFRKICKQEDAQALQKDLDAILSWSHRWQMRFNPSKCKVLRITGKRNPLTVTYRMDGNDLEEVENHPYLGVELDKNLSWNTHIDQMCAKAHKSLNFLRRNMYHCPEKTKETTYNTLVRPILEYSASAWDPGNVGKITQIESVQRKAARFVKGDWSYHSSVTNMLKDLNWRPLQERRLVHRLGLMRQAHYRQIAIDFPTYIHRARRPSLRKHPIQYLTIPTRINTYADSFWPRTIQSWNVLPNTIMKATSTESFKTNLNKQLVAGTIAIAGNRDYTSRLKTQDTTIILF